MAKIWKLPLHDPGRIASLARELEVPAVLAQLLLNRGIREPAHARSFLEPSLNGLHEPSLLPNVTEAADRIVRAIRAGRRIVIYGDYDADGVCGSALLLECLKLAGADVRFYVPHRLEEGYGLNSSALETIRTRTDPEKGTGVVFLTRRQVPVSLLPCHDVLGRSKADWCTMC